MDANQTAERPLRCLGGKENVRSNEACMTRLRVGVRDMSLVDVDAIVGVDGVLGVVCADTLQIAFGLGKANKMFESFSALTGISKGAAQDDVLQAARQNKTLKSGRRAGALQAFLKHVANIFVPMLPGIIGTFATPLLVVVMGGISIVAVLQPVRLESRMARNLHYFSKQSEVY